MDLPNGFSKQQIARCISSKRLELTILPTEKCNFRCTYCYEDFAIGRMKKPTVDGIKNLILARAPDLQELSISWFGGEPLLAPGVVREICTFAAAAAAEHDFTFTGGFTTNAYLLTPELLEELVGLNQNFFQVTLDGWGKEHDITRKLANGGGTFAVIWRNLLSARDSALSFEMLLRIHLTGSNFDTLKDLCREVYREFGRDSRFRLDFQDVRDLGGSGGASVDPLSAREFKRRVANLQHIAAQGEEPECISEATIDASVLEESKKTGESAGGRRGYEVEADEPYICYASKPNHLLIRADGRIGKCTVALDHPANTVGSIKADGTIVVDQGLMGRWFTGFGSFDLSEMGCPLPFVAKAHAEDNPSPRAIPMELAAV